MEDKYILVSKYLLKTITAQELDELNAWRKISERNEEEFQDLCESWEISHANLCPVIPGKEHVWQGIVDRIEDKKKRQIRRFIYCVANIAAVLLLGVWGVNGILNTQEAESVTFVVPMGQKAEVHLPDGTFAYLNSGSKLTYQTDYNREARSVVLEGQAFFDVTTNKEKPFEVLARNTKIKVYGTAFDVNAYDDTPNMEVVLHRGHVTVVSASTDELLADMKPNEKATVSVEGDGKCELTKCDAEVESVWRMGKLKIEDESLEEVVRKMEKWYGVHIQLSGVSENKHYWMTIKTETLKEMLELINKITPIVYTINGEEVSIVGKF